MPDSARPWVAAGDRVRDPVRLQAVRDTGLLDTAAEEAFDRLTRLATDVFDVPAAQITLVDDHRSFWKSFVGPAALEVSVNQGAVENSFCQYVIESGAPVIIGDTGSDHRTRDHPLITLMGICSWAGVPLLGADGAVVGTFCVIDRKTRAWTARDLGVLETLGHAASTEIALRAALVRVQRLSDELDAARG